MADQTDITKDQNVAKAIYNETATIKSMYTQLNNIFGGSQMFVMEYPTRGLNQLDYAYSFHQIKKLTIN